MTVLFYSLLVIFLFISALLCLIILVQDSKSMGLGASFGGDSESVFGTSTADVLKKFTAYLAGSFMILCLVLSLLTGKLSRSRASVPSVQTEQAVND